MTQNNKIKTDLGGNKIKEKTLKVTGKYDLIEENKLVLNNTKEVHTSRKG